MEIELRSEITVRLIQSMGGDSMIVAAAKVSTSGEEATKFVDQEANFGRINYLMKHRHGTPFEHSALTFFAHGPAFVWWEWVRHRWMVVECSDMSFNLESGRYRVLEPVFWIPRPERKMIPSPGFKAARPGFQPCPNPLFYERCLVTMRRAYQEAWDSYQSLIAQNVANEVARAVLGFGVYYSGWVTCNPRSLMTFLSLRTHEPTATFISYPQAEIEEAARVAETFLKEGWPLTYRAFVENGRVGP